MLHRHGRFYVGHHVQSGLRRVDDNGSDVKEAQNVGCQDGISLDGGCVDLVTCFQRNEGVEYRCLGKVLKLEWGVARGVSRQDPLAMDRLVVLFEHDDGVQGARDAEAVAPGHGQVQQGEIAWHLVGNDLVDRRHAHI